MSATTDLVQRLRGSATRTTNEAADTIEALQAERDALLAALDCVAANLRYWRDSKGEFSPNVSELSDTLRRVDAARTGSKP